MKGERSSCHNNNSNNSNNNKTHREPIAETTKTKLLFSPMDVYSWGKNEFGRLGLGDKR
jgi:alpha-tubulin suppressor-like RCC1 family protein